MFAPLQLERTAEPARGAHGDVELVEDGQRPDAVLPALRGLAVQPRDVR